MKVTAGGVTAAKGFQAASHAAGIKYKDRTDMAMVYSKEPCECAGTFTTNVVKAACVLWDKDIVMSDDAKDELEKALESFVKKHGFDGTFVDVFKKSPAFPSEYGSYSAKAIKKLNIFFQGYLL